MDTHATDDITSLRKEIDRLSAAIRTRDAIIAKLEYEMETADDMRRLLTDLTKSRVMLSYGSQWVDEIRKVLAGKVYVSLYPKR